jgi:hypothetical protein
MGELTVPEDVLSRPPPPSPSPSPHHPPSLSPPPPPLPPSIPFRSILKALPGSESLEEGLDTLIPNKQGEFTETKVAAPSKIHLYSRDNVPLFFDPSGKGDYAPSVYALWELPQLLPHLVLKHYAVTQYILGGASLSHSSTQNDERRGR